MKKRTSPHLKGPTISVLRVRVRVRVLVLVLESPARALPLRADSATHARVSRA